MRNCLNCEYACHGEDYREAFCMAHNAYVYIPLDDAECSAYIPVMKKSPKSTRALSLYFLPRHKLKGETIMIPKHVTALANHKGAAILHAGDMLIPVKIMDIEHEESLYKGAMTTFKGLVVDASAVSTATLTKAAKATANSFYSAQAFRDAISPRDLTGLLDPRKIEKDAAVYAAHIPCVIREICYDIENVDFTATSTTVFWKDGTKTGIVYQDGNPDFKEHDLALAFSLKAQGIEKVIFNNPHTIVLWGDKTKTIVKCQEGDAYTPATGLALCIAKKRLGNKGNFNEVFKKHIANY